MGAPPPRIERFEKLTNAMFDLRILGRIDGCHICGLRLFRGAAEPVLETRGTKARVVARRETLVIDCRAEIQGFGIGDYRPWSPVALRNCRTSSS